MQKGLKTTAKNVIFIAGCLILYLLLQYSTAFMDRKGMSSFNGVISAFQYGLCLIMVRRDNKNGLIASMLAMGMSLILIINAMLHIGVTKPLPGFCNIVFYIATLLMLGNYFRMREKEAVTDFLTGLLNRRGLYATLKRRIESEDKFNVVYVDLGNFKFINDNYGHAYGDELLKKISERLVKIVGNSGTVTRIGGDEFVVILDGGLDAQKTAKEMLEKIREKVVLVINGNKTDCYLTCYAGISSYPEDSSDYEALIKYADIAMYQAAKDNSSEPNFFDKDMAEFMKREMEVEKLIKEGLDNDYFYLVYQPQYRISGKVLRGFESLLRMKTPDGKFVSPGEFIPVAEKGDLILRIDDYVLRRAMREFKPVVDASSYDLTISVNVSAKNIGALDFPDRVKAIMDETGYPARNLEIEITEYCLVQSVDITIENIRRLRSMGVQVALDDFGTGYTSLNYLAKMPINLLKVDKSLVDDIERDRKSRDFVHAVISMGHLMGCEVISEGVENESQLGILNDQQCDFVQGYVWGRPLEYDAAKAIT